MPYGYYFLFSFLINQSSRCYTVLIDETSGISTAEPLNTCQMMHSLANDDKLYIEFLKFFVVNSLNVVVLNGSFLFIIIIIIIYY